MELFNNYAHRTLPRMISEQHGAICMSQEQMSKRSTLKAVINDILEEKDNSSPVDALKDDISLIDNLGLKPLDLAKMTVRLKDKYEVDVFEDDIVDEGPVVPQRIPPAIDQNGNKL